MRTNIEIDEKLMDEILEKSSIKTKKEVVDTALRQYLRILKLKELADLRGKLKWEGSLEDMRTI
ncbi:type II toxin-antitoxin system VapB family antitoxin [Aquiflexum lacus]|uniref:type II toxin-antitoxin system VapB family antitoxin n=1 Tax=Aquiflexum lacus TaxID=2483805 RepID=UPI001893B9A8|nr:type II toxin-antitoxin system VapB family antitoxin [Aquiflexum lacus]